MPNPFDTSNTPELTEAQRAILEKCTYTEAELAEAERIRKLLADAMARVPGSTSDPLPRGDSENEGA